jgi:hypothetical protein
MGRTKFYLRVLECWVRGGHDWKNILVVPPYRECRRCGGFDSINQLWE